jgi:hypothetical protein
MNPTVENNSAETQVACLPAGETKALTRMGKQTGTRYFHGGLSAAKIREAGKAAGLKGKELTEYVNRALTDRRTNVLAEAQSVALYADRMGFSAAYTDVKEKTITTRYEKGGVIVPAMPTAEDVQKYSAAERAKLLALLGVTEAPAPTLPAPTTTEAVVVTPAAE